MRSVYTKDLLDLTYDIGDFTYGRPLVYDWHQGSTLTIGKYTNIADEVTIILGGNHRLEWVSMYPFPLHQELWPTSEHITDFVTTKGDVTIGSDVWISNGVRILSGVTIGDGAILAAGANVIKDVEPYAIVGGNPAKEIKKRFSDEDIQRLLATAWWNWPDAAVADNMDILCSGDIDAVCAIDISKYPRDNKVISRGKPLTIEDDLRAQFKDLHKHADEQAKIIEHYVDKSEHLEREIQALRHEMSRSALRRALSGAKRRLPGKK